MAGEEGFSSPRIVSACVLRRKRSGRCQLRWPVPHSALHVRNPEGRPSKRRGLVVLHNPYSVGIGPLQRWRRSCIAGPQPRASKSQQAGPSPAQPSPAARPRPRPRMRMVSRPQINGPQALSLVLHLSSLYHIHHPSNLRKQSDTFHHRESRTVPESRLYFVATFLNLPSADSSTYTNQTLRPFRSADRRTRRANLRDAVVNGTAE